VSESFVLTHAMNEQVISAQDIATYGGLCALATFDRKRLKAEVRSFVRQHTRCICCATRNLNRPCGIGTWLDIVLRVPRAHASSARVAQRLYGFTILRVSTNAGRAACTSFAGSRARNLRTNEPTAQPELLLDIHLHSHVERLYSMIHKKALLQYCSPFLTVQLDTMAKAFNCPIATIEANVIELIRERQLSARINRTEQVRRRGARGSAVPR